MKHEPIDPFAAEDIRNQVEKIIRGLGHPEPPLNLDDVRELLKLDRQFYSSTNTGPLRERLSKIKIGAKQILRRPGLLLDAVNKAQLKALWLPDRKRILLDEDIPLLKQRHAEAHEITHSITPHHASFLFGDDGATLRPTCYEKLEAEANYGSGQLLFMTDRFTTEASDSRRTIEAILDLKKKFGNTITMTLWRFIEEAHKDEPLFGVVSIHPHSEDGRDNPRSPCRHFIMSPMFSTHFNNVSETAMFHEIQRYSSDRRGGPLGEGEVMLEGLDGQQHRFHMETFYNGYDALTLGTYQGLVHTQVKT